MKHLFLVSTQFNALIACSVALEVEGEKHLVFIDQKKDVDLTPFQSAGWFASVSDAGTREEAFGTIKSLCEVHGFQHIYCGNDRRIEFQWAMHVSGVQCVGHYLDDGLYSYLGFNKNPVADSLEFFIKRLKNGFPVTRPPFIGGSRFIQIAHLLFPESALAGFSCKDIWPIRPSRMQAVLEALASQSSITLKKPLNTYAYVVLVPHSSVLNPKMVEAIQQYLSRSDEPCLIKIHPRDTLGDIEQHFRGLNVDWMDQNVAFELLLQGLRSDVCLISGASTTLMTAKWLKPDSEVICIESSASNPKLHELYQGLGIHWHEL